MRAVLALCETTPGAGHETAHRMLAELYARVTGEPMPMLSRTERGKPYWVSSPWHCSLTHTRSLAACVLADGPVGLDAEPLNRTVSPRLGEKVLSDAELAAWERTGRDPRRFLTWWTLKEAAVKFTGEGLRGYPRDLSFSEDLPRPGLAGSTARFLVLELEGHVLSLCTEEDLNESNLEILKRFSVSS